MAHDHRTGAMVRDQKSDQRQLGVHPAHRQIRARCVQQYREPEPDRQRPADMGDSEQLALHDPENGLVLGFRVHGGVYKQAWQVKQPGEPGDHENNVKGQKPLHGVSAGPLSGLAV